jgi:excisionase family DNA binding protein
MASVACLLLLTRRDSGKPEFLPWQVGGGEAGAYLLRDESRFVLDSEVLLEGASQLLTLPEVAERLRISTRTVKRWIAAGSLPIVRVSASPYGRRVSVADLDAYVAARRSS